MTAAPVTHKVIGKSDPDKAAMIAVLLHLGLWDSMTVEERNAACECGEIWDTPAGNAFMQIVRRYQP